MNVHHLELFYYVAKHEGITAAVRKMPFGIQQPAVSGQLLQLEDALGVKLFQRRPFALTASGEALYDHIYPFFSNLSKVEARIKGEESKHLRIAASSTILLNYIPEILAQLQNKVSNLKLTLREIEPTDIHPVIVNQQCDVAISLLNDQVTDSVICEELLRLDLAIYVPEDWEVETLEDLLEEPEDGNKWQGRQSDKPLIGLPENELISKIFAKSLSKLNISWQVSIEVSSLDLIKKYVSLGFGAGIGVRMPNAEMLPGIRVIELKEFPQLLIGAIYQDKLKPVAELFLKDVREKSGELKNRIDVQ